MLIKEMEKGLGTATPLLVHKVMRAIWLHVVASVYRL